MTDKTIVLINGPPGSGKDMAATYFHMFLPNSGDLKISKPIKDAFQALFQFSSIELDMLLNETKDVEQESLNSMTCRGVQIDLGEVFMKPRFGDDVFGRTWVRVAEQLPLNYISASDCGFQTEALVIVKHFGSHNVKCIQLERPGHDFSIDSRGYIDCKALGIQSVRVNNKYGLDMYVHQIRKVLIEWGLPIRDMKT